jgi:regulator of nonsense transcripts 3
LPYHDDDDEPLKHPTRLAMSSAATINKTLAAKPKKEKRDKPQQPPANERLKTVVRRLPPNLPEDIFWQSVQTWVTDDTVT